MAIFDPNNYPVKITQNQAFLVLQFFFNKYPIEANVTDIDRRFAQNLLLSGAICSRELGKLGKLALSVMSPNRTPFNVIKAVANHVFVAMGVPKSIGDAMKEPQCYAIMNILRSKVMTAWTLRMQEDDLEAPYLADWVTAMKESLKI